MRLDESSGPESTAAFSVSFEDVNSLLETELKETREATWLWKALILIRKLSMKLLPPTSDSILDWMFDSSSLSTAKTLLTMTPYLKKKKKENHGSNSESGVITKRRFTFNRFVFKSDSYLLAAVKIQDSRFKIQDPTS